MIIPFIGQAYKARTVDIDAQTCVNLYPEAEEPNSKSVSALIGTPGLTLFSTPTTQDYGRGVHVAASATKRMYYVSGNEVYQSDTSGTPTLLGTLLTNTGTVVFADNGDVGGEVLLVDGTYAYYITMSSGVLTQLTSGIWDTVTPSHCAFQDGYFLVNDNEAQSFWVSDSYDVTTWSALEFASAEGTPDLLTALVSSNRELWLFGPSSYEVWWNTGSGSPPFAKIQGTLEDIGIGSPYSLAKDESNVFWLGSSGAGQGVIYMNEGYKPRRISTHALEYEFKTYTSLTDAIGYTYSSVGHKFYVISFPSDNITWVFDKSTGMWHRRTWLNSSTATMDRHRGLHHGFFNGNDYVQDWETSKIYQYDLDVYTDAGQTIVRERTAPHIHNDRRNIYFSRFELDISRGVGLATGQGSDPQVMLETSDDGGHTYGNERWKSFGKVGKYQQRAIWFRMGKSRDRVHRIRISDPVKVAIMGATIGVR